MCNPPMMLVSEPFYAHILCISAQVEKPVQPVGRVAGFARVAPMATRARTPALNP